MKPEVLDATLVPLRRYEEVLEEICKEHLTCTTYVELPMFIQERYGIYVYKNGPKLTRYFRVTDQEKYTMFYLRAL